MWNHLRKLKPLYIGLLLLISGTMYASYICNGYEGLEVAATCFVIVFGFLITLVELMKKII